MRDWAVWGIRLIYRRRIAAWLVGLGIAARLLRLACRFPLWSDEAAVALNLDARTWREILLPLDYHQVAPRLFLLLEKVAMVVGGSGEICLRTLPCLASILALILFAQWVVKVVSPSAAVIAVALAALSTPVIDLSAQLKPYAFDLLASVVILYFAERSLRSRNPWTRGWFLLPVIAVLTGLSFASLLVSAGAIAVGILAALLRRGRHAMGPHITYWLASATCVGAAYLLFFKGPHLSDEAHAFMLAFWRPAFPPLTPLPFARWFVAIHLGDMFDYPTGGIFTVPACLVSLIGGYRVLRRRPWLFALLISPFVTTFFAAALRQYPYGWKIRMSQQFAPSIWIFMGAGAAWLISLLPPARAKLHPRRIALASVVGVIGAIGAAVVVIGIVKPYEHAEDAQERAIADGFSQRAPEASQVLFTSNPENFPRPLLWYLRAFPQQRGTDASAKPGRHTLVLAIEPSDEGPLTKIIALEPQAPKKEWQVPGRAPGTRVHIVEIN